MAMDFQKYLDEAFSKINIADFLEPEPEVPPQDIYREIRELIVYERRKQGISQEELAERSGLTPEELVNIENGVAHPSIETLQEFAQALGKRLVVDFQDEDIFLRCVKGSMFVGAQQLRKKNSLLKGLLDLSRKGLC